MSRTSLGRLGLLFGSLLGLLCLFSASAFAAGKPIVTGSPASNKSLTTVTINGTVNPNGATTSYKFEWGETEIYGKSTSLVGVGSGTTVLPVSASLTGLEAGKTYHYRVSATNSFGTTVSEDVQFVEAQWRVGGKVLSEYPEGVGYVPQHADWEMIGEGMTKGGTAVKVVCAYSKEEYAGGRLGSFYRFPFAGCKTFLNGTESKKCKISYTELKLNAVLVPTTGGNLFMGETCSIGEEISISNGFEISLGSALETTPQTVTLTAKSSLGTVTFTIKGNWELLGILERTKFGIS